MGLQGKNNSISMSIFDIIPEWGLISGVFACSSHLTTNTDSKIIEKIAKTFWWPYFFRRVKISRHFSVIKKRIEAEVHTFPSEIFEDEIIKLKVFQGISAEAIMLDHMRFTKVSLKKFRQKINQKFEDIEPLDFSK